MSQEQRNAFMNQVLEPDARVRLANIQAVKPEKATQLQNVIISNVQKGTVQGKISEKQLIDLLEQFAEIDKETSTVEFKRRNAFDSDDDIDVDKLDL